MGLSLPHLLIIALLVFLLFGAGRFPHMMGDLAKGIKSFKEGLKDEDDKKAIAKREDASSDIIEQKTTDRVDRT